MIVVATTERHVRGLCARLGELGARPVRVVAPNATRRVVLAEVGDARMAEPVAVTLRAEGELAVTRPDDGRLEAWMRHTAPVQFGERLSICFAWSEHERGALPGLVELGPGGFGNGRHPATRLVLEELLKRIEGAERVLDVGCGSGVLGLCALRLGASRVVALDVDVDAVAATRRNALINGVDRRVRASLAPLEEIGETFDVVVANVGRSAVVELAPQLVERVAPGGWLAVSGFSPSQCTLVGGFLRPLVELDRRISEEWAAVVFAQTAGAGEPGDGLVG